MIFSRKSTRFGRSVRASCLAMYVTRASTLRLSVTSSCIEYPAAACHWLVGEADDAAVLLLDQIHIGFAQADLLQRTDEVSLRIVAGIPFGRCGA